MISINRFKSIKTKLFFTFFLLFLAFSNLIGFITFSVYANNYKENALTQYNNSMSSHAGMMSHWLEQNIKTLSIYSTTDILKSMDQDAIGQYLSKEIELDHTVFDYFIIADESMNYFTTNNNYEGTLSSEDHKTFYNQSINQPHTVSNLFVSESENREVLMIAVPVITDKGNTVAFGGVLYKETFQAIFEDGHFSSEINNSISMIIDTNSQIIITSSDPTRIRQINLTPAVNSTIEVPKDAETLVFDDITESVLKDNSYQPSRMEANDSIYLYTGIEHAPYWIMITQVPIDIHLAPLNAAKYLVFALLIIFLLIGYYASNKLSENFSKPIISLKDTFEKAANGNLYATATKLTNDEIGDAAQSFNQMMQQFRLITYYDSLTDLSNYKYFVEQLETLITISRAEKDEFAVVRLGIDRFRNYNNALGVNTGNKILKKVAETIGSTLGSRRYLSRVAGDEFAFIITGAGASKKAIAMIEYINKQLKEGVAFDDSNIYITASSGISLYPQHSLLAEELISQAGIAMTIAKSNGLGDHKIYKEEQGALSAQYVSISNHIRDGIKNNEFHLVYQPIKEVASNRYTSMETLVRWNHSEFGPLSPDLFIKLAEENGMIIELGYWIMENAMRDYSELHKLLKEPLTLAINISPLQLIAQDFSTTLFEIIRKYDVDPKLIVLEITERILIDSNYEITSILNRIKDFGCKISLDDFGTGYSSLNYLYKYPFDIMKIDKSFIDGIVDCHNKQNLVKSMVQIAGSMNFKTVAEGVETKEQMEFLSEVGCNKIQGYYYSKPLDRQDIKTVLTEEASN